MNSMEEQKHLVKLAEAFNLLPYSVPTIRVYAAAGKIPCYMVGKRYYVDLNEIKEYAKTLIVRVEGNHGSKSDK